LEEELMRLRGEISRIDPDLPRRAAGIAPLELRQQAQSHVSWDLGDGRPGSGRRNTADGASRQDPGVRYPEDNGDHDYGDLHPDSAPPPPPLMGAGQEGDFDDLVVDPEQRRREKEERQRRREEKRKQREAAKKPMTLADIIRSAGPDPIRRLKPASKKPVDIEAEAVDGFANLRDMLTSPESKVPDRDLGDKSEAVVATGASSVPTSTSADDPGGAHGQDSFSKQLASESNDTINMEQPASVPFSDQSAFAATETTLGFPTEVSVESESVGSATAENPLHTSKSSSATGSSSQTLDKAVRSDTVNIATRVGSSSEETKSPPAPAATSGTQDSAACIPNDIAAPVEIEGKPQRHGTAKAVSVSRPSSAQEQAATTALASISSLAASLPSLSRRSSQCSQLDPPTDLEQRPGNNNIIGYELHSISPPLSSSVATKSPERMTVAEKRLVRRSDDLAAAKSVSNAGSSEANDSMPVPSVPNIK
jgi:hypothetical protein